jgi:hypothetical protein
LGEAIGRETFNGPLPEKGHGFLLSMLKRRHVFTDGETHDVRHRSDKAAGSLV